VIRVTFYSDSQYAWACEDLSTASEGLFTLDPANLSIIFEDPLDTPLVQSIARDYSGDIEYMTEDGGEP
jgi:hypothetical protein